MRLSRGALLVVVGLLVLTTTLVVSAATAPSRDVSAVESDAWVTHTQSTPSASTGTDAAATTPTANFSDGPHVLVGSQGGGTNWQKKGSVYRLDDHDVVWTRNDRDSYFDVTRLENGHVVAAFMHNGYETGCGPYPAPCTKTGFRVFDPSTGSPPRVVLEYSFPVREPTHSELHDVEPLGDGRFVIADMEHERIAIIDEGRVEWEWNAAESGLYDAPPDVTQRDWLHINDVDHLGDGRFLVSVRNANQLLVVERGAGVVEVINADTDDSDDGSCTTVHQLADFDDDGDVRCGDPGVLNHQHNPQWLGSGRVLVADSDNNRVVELRREDGDWAVSWRLERAGGLLLQWPRDADRLPNGNTLVTDSLNRRVFEVTPAGRVVWSYATPLIPYEADRLPEGELAGPYERSTAAPGAGDGDGDGESSATTGTTRTTPVESSPADLPSPPNSNAGFRAADIPGLSLLLVGIKAVVPRLPIWFGEFQLLVTLLSLGVVGVGAVDHRRTGN